MPGHRHRRHGAPDGGIPHPGHARGALYNAQQERITAEIIAEDNVASPILGNEVELELADNIDETTGPQPSSTTDEVEAELRRYGFATETGLVGTHDQNYALRSDPNPKYF